MSSEKEKDFENDVIPPHSQSNAAPDVQLTLFRRVLLLVIFCLSLFVDTFSGSSMIICVDSIRKEFNIPSSIATWILTAYNLTFGSFLLLAGRISDIYHPKPVFIFGFSLIGVVGIGGGFAKSIISFSVARAIQGIGAAMTIPSATAMITMIYTTPTSRGIALTFFAAVGTMGLCSGLLLGGVIVEFATWRWVMWIIAMVTIPLSVLAVFVTPGKRTARKLTSKNMDVIGIAVITGSLILLVFSFSQAPVVGWGTARVLAPLIISVVMILGFFYWQTRVPDDKALIPPRLWFIPNFLVFVSVSFSTQINLSAPVFIFSEYWAASYGWDPLTIGLHVLPIGVTAAVVCVILAPILGRLPPRPALVCASSLCGFFTILLVFASSSDRYWGYVFPALILVTIGSAAEYIISSIGVVTSVPPKEVGIASAIFSAAQQVGGAITIAIVTTILAQVQRSHPYPSFKAPSSAMWFMVALGIFQAVIVLVFFKLPPKPDREEELVEANSKAEEPWTKTK